MAHPYLPDREPIYDVRIPLPKSKVVAYKKIGTRKEIVYIRRKDLKIVKNEETGNFLNLFSLTNIKTNAPDEVIQAMSLGLEEPDKEPLNKHQAAKKSIETSDKKSKFLNKKEVLKVLTTLPTVYCNKCKHNSVCPYYLKNTACYFLTDILNAKERKTPEVFAVVREAIEYFCKNSTLFTAHQSMNDILYLNALCLIYCKLYDDYKLKNVPVRRYKKDGAKLTELGRKTLPASAAYYNAVKASQERIKKRWKILNISSEYGKRYYPSF